MNKAGSEMKTARWAGFFYLLLVITGTTPFIIKDKLFIYGDPARTVENIMSSPFLLSGNLIIESIMALNWILIGIFLYILFKKVSRSIALIMLSLVLVGGALVSINIIGQAGALLIVKNGSGYLAAFNQAEINALVMLFVDIARDSAMLNYLCMGLWMFPFSYLVFKSGYFPRLVSIIWAILLIMGGLGYIVDLITFFLLPEYFISVTEFLFMGDLFSMVWLLVKGANVPLTENK